jgi:TRAP-type mannitol/chloroaromatic compound transport system permease small subunit
MMTPNTTTQAAILASSFPEMLFIIPRCAISLFLSLHHVYSYDSGENSEKPTK